MGRCVVRLVVLAIEGKGAVCDAVGVRDHQETRRNKVAARLTSVRHQRQPTVADAAMEGEDTGTRLRFDGKAELVVGDLLGRMRFATRKGNGLQWSKLEAMKSGDEPLRLNNW